MTSLKLTTGPGNPCSGIGMEANGSTAVAEMRSTTEATNGLALDGLTVFGSVMRVNRPKDYTGPDTDPPKLDPNLLLQICTGSNAEKEYSEVVRVGRQLLETYREPEPEKDANVPSVVMTSNDRSLFSLQMRNSEARLRPEQVCADPQHSAGAGGVGDPFLLRPLRRRAEGVHAARQQRALPGRRGGGVGDGCWWRSRYREQLSFEIAMEGLQGLPIFNGTSLEVETPDKKWPGFPQRVSVVSSRRGEGSESRSLAGTSHGQYHIPRGYRRG